MMASDPEDPSEVTMLRMWDRVDSACEAVGMAPKVMYSAYGTDGDATVDNLDDTAFFGKCCFVHKFEERWLCDDAPPGRHSYTSRIVTNPTWLEIAVLANEMMLATGDYHHCFLEGIEQSGIALDGVSILRFCMGS